VGLSSSVGGGLGGGRCGCRGKLGVVGVGSVWVVCSFNI
jgi:hypothetical protein